MKEWFNQNKVLILGALSAVALGVYDLFMKQGETDTKILVYSGLLLLASYLANNLRGQAATIIGLVGQSIATILTMEQTGQPISWLQLIAQIIVGYITIVAPPAKSRGYEHDPVIASAKVTGEEIAPTPLGPSPENIK